MRLNRMNVSWSFNGGVFHGNDAAVDPELPSAAVSPATSGNAVSSPRQPPAVPDYELLRCIGRGSYGDVWLARNVLGDLRAVKFVYRDRFADPRPFEREFEGIQKFEPISRSHPSQLAILHVGKNEGAECFYYIMELADAVEPRGRSVQCSVIGRAEPQDDATITIRSALPLESPPAHSSQTAMTADRLLASEYSPHTLRSEVERHGRLPPADCVQIGLALTTALEHLHSHGLVHRDIKPSNIIFVRGQPKLADIGLVTDAGDAASIVGTEGYLAPEGPGSPQADLYSLGKVLYEICTGRDRRHCPDLPLDFQDWADHPMLLELNEILLTACARDPRQRYASAAAMRDDLAWLQRGESVRKTRAGQTRRAMARKAGLATAVVAALTLAGLTAMRELEARTRRQRSAQDATMPALSGTTNLEAWKLYERGNVCFRRFTIEGERMARAHLTEAVRLDPSFLAAQNLLFAGYVNSWALPDQEAKAGMRAMAKQLLEVNPEAAEGHYAQGYVDFYLDLKFPEAQKRFEKAIQIKPVAFGRTLYGCYLVFMGRQEAAREQLRGAVDLDPGFPINDQLLGCSYYAERNYERALAHYQKALELAPDFLYLHFLMAGTYEAAADYLRALEHFEKVESGRGRRADELKLKYVALRQAVNETGAVGYWRVRLERAQRRSHPENQPYEMASILAQLGRTTEALDWLDKAYARRDNVDRLLFDHYWDGLHKEPRFQALLKKVGYRN